MEYSDFTLEMLKERFGIRTDVGSNLFAPVPAAPISNLLRDTLAENVPLALTSAPRRRVRS
jgi:hypothetical protein